MGGEAIVMPMMKQYINANLGAVATAFSAFFNVFDKYNAAPILAAKD